MPCDIADDVNGNITCDVSDEWRCEWEQWVHDDKHEIMRKVWYHYDGSDITAWNWSLIFDLKHAAADVEKMVLGNKCDMEDKRQVSKERGEQVFSTCFF